jgi:hypothetical protein
MGSHRHYLRPRERIETVSTTITGMRGLTQADLGEIQGAGLEKLAPCVTNTI